MAGGKTINDLPDEILVEIFSYLSFKDLILSAQLVNRRWAEVSRDVELWRDITYTPDPRTEHSDIVNILEKAPMLRSFVSETEANIYEIVDALCVHCKDIRKLEFWNSTMLSSPLLKKLLEHFPNIESLCLGLNKSNGEQCMKLLGQCDSLKRLAIYGCEHRQEMNILKPIADGCTGLEYLNLVHFYHSDPDLAYLLRIKKHQLQALLLNCNNLSVNTICSLRDCTKLEILTLHARRTHCMSEDELKAIGSLSNLKALCLLGLGSTSSVKMESFFRKGKFSRLQELDLSYYGYLNEAVAKSIHKCCPSLKRLILRCCFDKSVNGLEDMLKFSHLELLVLSWCDNLTEDCIAQLSKCHKLKHLNLKGCESLTDEHVGRIVSDLKLEYLNLTSCLSLTDDVISFILRCSTLRTLVLDNCLLTGKYFPVLLQNMKHLTCVSVKNCKNISQDIIVLLKELMARSEVLHNSKKGPFYFF